jgi:hypothetical protein
MATEQFLSSLPADVSTLRNRSKPVRQSDSLFNPNKLPHTLYPLRRSTRLDSTRSLLNLLCRSIIPSLVVASIFTKCTLLICHALVCLFGPLPVLILSLSLSLSLSFSITSNQSTARSCLALIFFFGLKVLAPFPSAPFPNFDRESR